VVSHVVDDGLSILQYAYDTIMFYAPWPWESNIFEIDLISFWATIRVEN
jgi:hypothetical protein